MPQVRTAESLEKDRRRKREQRAIKRRERWAAMVAERNEAKESMRVGARVVFSEPPIVRGTITKLVQIQSQDLILGKIGGKHTVELGFKVEWDSGITLKHAAYDLLTEEEFQKKGFGQRQAKDWLEAELLDAAIAAAKRWRRMRR